jgi:flavorubredoxin
MTSIDPGWRHVPTGFGTHRSKSSRKEQRMHAIVVYESVWGNTEAIARAVADGLGPTSAPTRPTRCLPRSSPRRT